MLSFAGGLRWISAAIAPIAPFSPPVSSPIAVAALTGGPSTLPFIDIHPDAACAIGSYPARSEFGPNCPQPVIET